MEGYRITELARRFGLARSTLLHYDHIGLLPPGGRTAVGYRVYTSGDLARLERICALREAEMFRKHSASYGYVFFVLRKGTAR